MKEIQTIIFDFGNVIIPLKDFTQWREVDFGEIFKSKKELEKLYENGIFLKYEKGEIDTQIFLETLQKSVKKGFSSNDITRRWNLLLKEIPDSRIEFLKDLKKRYRLFLLSNTNEIHIRHICENLYEKYGHNILDEIFETCYYSYEMNMIKPDSEIYRYVLRDNSLDPKSTLFIDDNLENLAGAAELGIQIRHILPEEEVSDILKDL